MEPKLKSGKKIRFNLIDLLLLTVVLASAVWLWMLLSGNTPAGKTDETQTALCEIDLEVPKIREEFRGKINIGDKVWDPDTGTVLGEVVDVTYAEATVEGIDSSTGQTVLSSYPGYLSVALTVRNTCEIEDGGCSVGDFRILVGSSLSFRLPGLYMEGTIDGITIGEEA